MSRLVIAAALALAAILPAVQAQAQSIRTFVSTAGNDSNPCSITQSCRHFQAAVNATALAGEVDALDAGAYGSFIISRAITIEGQGWSYVAPGANGDGISIKAVSGKVTLRGLSLNGVGASGAAGIVFDSGSSLSVENCVIENFASTGLLFQPNSSTLSKISVSNTKVSGNSFGIAIQPTGTGTTNGVLNHVDIENNNADGINLSTSSQTVNVTITDSISAQNVGDGVKVTSANSNAIRTTVYVRNSTFDGNGNNGVEAANNFAFILLTRSMIWGNNNGYLSPEGSGGIISYGDNAISFDDQPGAASVTYQ